MLQIEPLLDRRPDQLSGGQRQRVAIGRALVRDAAVFLFDEPLSNLDAQLRNELRVEIKRLHQRLGATTMIYVTHDQIEALTLADRIAVMKDRVIQQLGSPHEIYHRPANRFVAGFVGSPADELHRRPARAGRRRPGLRRRRPPPAARRLRLRAPARSRRSRSTLGVRPEHLALDDGAGTWDGFTVDMVEPHGRRQPGLVQRRRGSLRCARRQLRSARRAADRWRSAHRDLALADRRRPSSVSLFARPTAVDRASASSRTAKDLP